MTVRRPAVPTELAPGGDPAEAVKRLLDRHGGRIHALARRLCRNADDADDLVQETFLAAFRKWHTFRGEADAGTWLYTIALRGGRRRFRQRKPTPLSQLLPWTETTVSAVAAAPRGREDAAERRESIDAVQRAIAALPEHLRVPIVLKEVCELPVEEVAATLGLAANTVKTRLHRARLALRKAFTREATPVPAPAPIYEKQVCLDLMKAKLEAMDRGRGFAIPQAEVCARCRAVFRELDLVQDACADLGRARMPAATRRAILAAIAERDGAERERPARRGRPPKR